MAKTDLTIDITGKLKKSYSLKGKTNIIIIGDLETNIVDMKASGSTLTVNLEGGKTLKFTNISDPHQINITADGDVQTLEKFYDHPVDIDWTPKKGNKVTATVFDDFIDLSETTYAPTSKKAIKNNTGLNINGGKGDDYITGSKYNDTITGGLGENRIFYDENEQDEFGSDTIKFTKGENLIIDLTSMDLDEDDFRELLTHDSKNLFISLSDEEKIKLNSFYKTNGAGANGSVKVLLYEAQDETEEDLLVDLNEDVLLSLTEEDANKKGAITGSRLGDSITGGEGVKSIDGGAGNDYIVGGEGNQTLKGGAGADIFEFTKDDGVDVITDGKKEDKIIINDVENMSDLAFKKVGNNLEIFYGEDEVEPTEENPFGLDDDNKIVIKNYFKTKEADRIDTVVVDDLEYSLSDWYYITQGSGTIKGTEGRDILWGSAKADTLYGYDGDDDIYAAGGNDKLTGGKGDDNLYGGSGKNTFFFTAGDGDDYVWDADKDDVIQIDSDVAVACEKNGDNLIIKYANDSITLYDYYTTSEGNRVDTLKVKNGKKYNTISIKDILPVEPVVDSVLNVNDGDVVNLASDTDYEAIKFVSIADPKYVNWSRSGEGHGDDLIVQCGSAKVTLTDYMKGGHNVQFFQTGPYTTNYDIPYHIGTDGDDTFNAQNLDESFFTKGGNDTINFNGKDFGNNEIYSDGTSDNTISLNFDNYSFTDDQFSISGDEGNGKYLRLAIDVNKKDAGGTHHGKINYDNYFDGDTPTVQITDKNADVISVAKKTDNYINLSDDEHKNNNHAQFLFGSGKKTVISNTKTNYITASAYDHNMQLDYTYKGGQDKVNSRPNTNDEYKVETFNKDTRLVIDDNDGVDKLNLGADADNIRLFFDVVLKEESFEEYTPSATVETAFVHADVFSSETLKSYYEGGTNRWISGVVSTSFGSHEETQTTEYNIETVVANGEILDLDKWKDAVAKKVGKWFENWFNDKIDQGVSPADLPRNLSDAISTGLITNTQLTELLNLFDFKYSDIGGGVIEPDSDGFFNLSDGDGASIIKTYTSANKIRFVDAEVEDLTYTKDGNNLVIKYSDGESDAEEDDDTVTIENFFTNTSRIDDVYFGEEELPTLSIKTNAIIGVELDRDAGFIKSDSGCTDYIVKVLANGTNSLTGLTSDDFVDFEDEDTSYYELNSVGMNVMCGADKVIITDFDPQTPPVIRIAGEEDDMSEKDLVVMGLSNFDGTSYGFATYSITGTTSVDTLTGGAGEDVFVTYQGADTVTGGEGADSFRFWTGHGVDTIVDAEYDDTIIIDYKSDTTGGSRTKTAADVTAVMTGDNKVEIRYSDSDKVIIDNYDPEDPGSNIDTVKVITADGTTTELSIADLLSDDGGDDPSGDDYTDFTPDYSCDDPASDTNTYVINPTGYMTISVDGNDLVFSWWDESDGDVERRLENYFTEGSVYKYISVNGEDPEILDEYCHIQIGTDANEIFTGMPDPEEMGPGTDDIIFAGGGDDKITGKGGTNYINAGEGNNKIYLSDEHWEEAYILNGGGSDTLIFPEGAEINASLNGDDLHISYYGTVFLDEPDDNGETTRYYDGSVVIENYSNGTSVQYAQIGDAEPIAIADFIDSHQTPTDENTLAILTNKNVDCSKDATNNLVFKYYDDDGNLVTETTTDEHKFVRIGYNGDPVSINNIQIGTDSTDNLNGNNGELIFAGGGNDNLTSGNSSDSLYLGSGNDTVTFGQHFGRDQIWSVGDSTNSDKLIFQNHSLVGRTLNFSYGETYHQDSDWNSILDTKDLQIHSGTSEKYGGMGRFGGDIIYHDYFSYNTPNITITDATGDTYALERYKTAQTLDWTNARVNKAALLEIAQYTDSSVVSGNNPNKANYVYSRGGGRLDYTYQGGIDMVNSASGLESANDNYNIASFNSNTDLILSDAGGIGDTMQINASTDNIRLIFDVGADVDGEEYYNNVYWSGMKLVHTDNFSAATLSEYLKGDAELKGVTLNVNQEISDENTVYGYECGIEQVTTTDCNTGIDMNAWKATITDNVKQWLDTYGVADKDGNVTVSGTLKNTELTGDDLTTALNELYACYNVNGAALEEAPVIDKGGITAVSSSASENWAFGTGNNNLTLTANIGADTITSLATKYNDKNTDTLNFTKMSFGDKLSIDINDKDVIFGDRTDMKNNSVTYTNFFDTEAYEEQIHNKTVVIDSTGEYEVINRYVEAGHDFNYDDWTYDRDKKYITLINNPNNKGGSIFSWTETNIVHVTGDGDMTYAYMGGHDEVVSHGASEDYYNFNGGGYNNGEVNITNVFDENTKWTIRDFGGEDELRLQTDIENVRLAFDCDKDGNVGNEISFVYNGVFGLDTLTSVTNNAINWTAGTIKVEAPTETGVFGIETVEYQSNPYGMATQIDVDSWIAAVKADVANWFDNYNTNNEYSSVQDAFTNCKDQTALEALVNCYNIRYSDIAQG